MAETSITEAKNRLTRLIYQAERGETVHITRRGRPVAVLLSEAEYGRLSRGTVRPTFWDAIREMRTDPRLRARRSQARRDRILARSRSRGPRLRVAGMRYLLDTSVVSEPIRTRLSSPASRRTHRSWPSRSSPGRRCITGSSVCRRVHDGTASASTWKSAFARPCLSCPSTRRPANGRRANVHAWGGLDARRGP